VLFIPQLDVRRNAAASAEIPNVWMRFIVVVFVGLLFVAKILRKFNLIELPRLMPTFVQKLYNNNNEEEFFGSLFKNF